MASEFGQGWGGKVEMYVLLWEFKVRPEKVDAFLAAYCSNGAWTRLFRRAEGYLGTELLSSLDTDNGPSFVTIDRWRAKDDFVRFQQEFGSEYRALDTELEGLTFSERKLGAFAREGCAANST
jgi:heme-degrading monooxygenase HmoA